MIIGLLRHGESEANVADLLSSRPDDEYHLTPLGKRQVIDAVEDSFFKKPLAAIYTSPFYRTKESASIIATQLSYEGRIIIDERISEMKFGSYSGRTRTETDEEVKRIFAQSFAGDNEIRMSPSGENRREFLTRTYGFILSLLETYNDEDVVLVVTHSSVIAVLEKLWIQLKNPRFQRKSTQNAELKSVQFTKNDTLAIQRLIDGL